VSDIRRARADDLGALAALEERLSVAALGHLFGEHPYPVGDVLVRWSLVLEQPDVSTLVAHEGEELVGYVAHDGTSLRHLGVAPDRFGTGLAGELHERAVGDWRALGTRHAQLWVLAGNSRARRFYERNGWAADGREQECPWAPYPVEVGYRLTL
jgi:GNAT superfamily N-acetyltransferase